MKRIVSLLLLATQCISSVGLDAKENNGHNLLPQDNSLRFSENKGQVHDQNGNVRNDIDYSLDGSGMMMYIGDGQLHYQWYSKSKSKIQNSKIEGSIDYYRMDVSLIGADKHAVVQAEGLQPDVDRYYVPNREAAIVSRSYTKLTYKNVYPNIDWVLYISNKSKVVSSKSDMQQIDGDVLKYDFVVHEGGDAAQIKLRYDGAAKLELKDGALIATTPMGSITEDAPYCYDAATKEKIGSSFALNGNTLSYNLATGRDSKGDVVIDPKLQWCTLYGYQITKGEGIQTDAAGNIYFCGRSNSATSIATTGAFQGSFAGQNGSVVGDGYIAKFSPEGKRIWGTWYGGANTDFLPAMAISGTALYVAGATASSGMATTSSHQNSIGNTVAAGVYDGLLIRFDTAGNRIWATYYGGTASDQLNDVACDVAGNVYVVGTTGSSNAIASTTAMQTALAGVTDMFLVRFNGGGVRQWGTYYGGTGVDSGTNLAIDGSGNVHVSGLTQSSGMGTGNTFQPSFSGVTGINYDVLLTKFTSAGVKTWATYYGSTTSTNRYGYGSALAADASGNVYMVGTTLTGGGGTYYGTTGTFQSTAAADNINGYLAKFSSTGTRTWGTYISGSSYDYMMDVKLSPVSGNVYVSGWTESPGLATADAHQTGLNFSDDALIMELSPATGTRIRGTYFGDIYTDQGAKLALTNTGKLYLTGSTSSTGGFATTGAHQTVGNPSGVFPMFSSGFLASFISDTSVFFKQPFADTVLCGGDSLIIRDTVYYGFRSGNTFTVQLSNASGSFGFPTTIGTSTASSSGTIRCRIPNTALGNNYRIRIVATAPAYTSADNYYNIRIKANAQNFSLSTNSPACENDTIRLNGATTTVGTIWAWAGPNSYSSTAQNSKRGEATLSMAGKYVGIATVSSTGCSLKDSVTVVVSAAPGKPVASSNTPICSGTNLNLSAVSASTGVSYTWTGPNGYTSATQNPTRTGVAITDAGDYIVTASIGSCYSKDTETVVIYSGTTMPTASNNGPVCIGSNLNLTATPVPGATYQWTGPNGFTSTDQNPVIKLAQTVAGGAYNVTASMNGCTSAANTTTVSMVQGASVSAYPNPGNIVCAGKSFNLNSLVTNPGVGVAYQWYHNGTAISGANTALHIVNTTIADGDSFYVTVTEGAGAQCTTPVYSNTIKMQVMQYLTPTVTMTATDSSAWTGLQVEFTATTTNAGAVPLYQWRLFGTNIPGATSNVYSTATLKDNDIVCVDVTSAYRCANPAKVNACKTVRIATGISKVGNAKVSIYPNPFNKQVTISGLQTGARIQLFDVYGRLVYESIANVSVINISTEALSTGNYVLTLTDKDGMRSTHKVVKTN